MNDGNYADDDYEIVTITFGEYLKYKAVPWMGQRDLSEDRVNELIKIFEYNYSICFNFKMDDPICITPINGTYYIYDGQHRDAAFKFLISQKNYKDSFKIPVKIKYCDDFNTIFQAYERKNDIIPQKPSHMLKNRKNIPCTQPIDKPNDNQLDKMIEEAISQLSKKFNNINNRKFRPDIHQDSLIDFLITSDILSDKMLTVHQLVQYLIFLHDELSTKTWSQLSGTGLTKKDFDKYQKELSTTSNYHSLGLFITCNDGRTQKSAKSQSTYWLNLLLEIINLNILNN